MQELKKLLFPSLLITDLKLKEVDEDRFIVRYKISKNCQLKKFLNSVGLAYRKGYVYYELRHKETISEDKELIFMKVFR